MCDLDFNELKIKNSEQRAEREERGERRGERRREERKRVQRVEEEGRTHGGEEEESAVRITERRAGEEEVPSQEMKGCGNVWQTERQTGEFSRNSVPRT